MEFKDATPSRSGGLKSSLAGEDTTDSKSSDIIVDHLCLIRANLDALNMSIDTLVEKLESYPLL